MVPPSSLITPLSEGWLQMILHCARRTTTALSWGFREHRGLLEPPFLLDYLYLPSFLSRVAWVILDCARRTSTFLSCAFREQEDNQATLPRP